MSEQVSLHFALVLLGIPEQDERAVEQSTRKQMRPRDRVD
jgi:hypothetical protein